MPAVEFVPCLVRSVVRGEVRAIRLGHPLLDDYLEFVAARARTNTWLATAYDLKVFFAVVGKEPAAVTTADVFAFIRPTAGAAARAARWCGWRTARPGCRRARSRRRLSSVSGLFAYLVARGDGGVRANPVPRGLATRRAGTGSAGGGPAGADPAHAAADPRPGRGRRADGGAAHRTGTGRWCRRCCSAGCAAARCSGCGWTMSRPASGGCSSPRARAATSGSCRSRPRFFAALGCLPGPGTARGRGHRPGLRGAQGPDRGRPLSAPRARRDPRGARPPRRAAHATCHELRHTCLTRLREAGMALEAVQAQAGHASIESTRIYLHLADGWLADEYRRAGRGDRRPVREPDPPERRRPGTMSHAHLGCRPRCEDLVEAYLGELTRPGSCRRAAPRTAPGAPSARGSADRRLGGRCRWTRSARRR